MRTTGITEGKTNKRRKKKKNQVNRKTFHKERKEIRYMLFILYVYMFLLSVQRMLGGANHTPENDYLQRDNTQAEQVSAALSSFLNMLHAVDGEFLPN